MTDDPPEARGVQTSVCPRLSRIAEELADGKSSLASRRALTKFRNEYLVTETRIQGIVPPLVTPLVSRDQLDEPGLLRLIDHVIAGGVHGIFLLGTTGEAPSLSYRLRRQVIRQACQYVSDRVPVYVGVTDTSFVESVELARVARDAGAAAVVLSTPYYFPAGQTELVQYVRRIVPELPLPVVLYNMPSLTKVWFEPETLAQLTEIQAILGVKDSSGDLAYFQRIVELKAIRPDWTMMMGPEHLLVPALKLGADGGVHGGANLFPRLFVRAYELAVADQKAELEPLVAWIEQLQQIYEVGKYGSKYIKATKCGLSLLGICDDQLAEPFNHFLPPERARVSAILDELKLNVLRQGLDSPRGGSEGLPSKEVR